MLVLGLTCYKPVNRMQLKITQISHQEQVSEPLDGISLKGIQPVNFNCLVILDVCA